MSRNTKTQSKSQKVQELIQAEDPESRVRIYSGPMKFIVPILLCIWTVFQIYYTTFGMITAVNLRAIHCMFLLLFTFLLFPTYKGEKRARKLPPIWDIALIALAIFAFGFLILNYERIARSGGRVNQFELFVAGCALFTIFEAARRASGNLAFLALIFFAYNWLGVYMPRLLGHNGFSVRRILTIQFWGTEGVLGTGIGVSATYIFLFVVFGAFLKYSGFSKFINDFALTLVGQTPGGPAKVAVIASALLGMINGSSIANVATTGTITIPLMKRTGYTREFSGAVEAVASTGGQFCPPIMGAVGFVMAEFLGISYTYVLIAAIVPATLYYLGLLLAVHLEAKRMGLSGLSRENIPDAMEVIKKQGHLAIPLFALIGLLYMGYTPLYAAVMSIFITVAASWLRPETRMTPKKIFLATIEGAQGAVSVGICCVVIGIIVATVTLTSLGLNLGYLILDVVKNGNVLLTGLLVMIMSTLLGMGVPGVAAYVIVQSVAVPVLLKTGIMPLAAHMFCLLYASLSDITPPVAMSAYVASGIAGGDQTKTGLLAVRLGLIGFIIPFFFLDNPLLLLGAVPASVGASLWAFFTALIGTFALVCGLEGWAFCRASWLERLAFIAFSPMLLYPDLKTDIIGLACIGTLLFLQFVRSRKQNYN